MAGVPEAPVWLAAVPPVAALVVTVNAVGRMEKSSVEHPTKVPCVTRTRTWRDALAWIGMVTVARLEAHAGEGENDCPAISAQVERQPVWAVSAPELLLASSNSTVIGVLL